MDIQYTGEALFGLTGGQPPRDFTQAAPKVQANFKKFCDNSVSIQTSRKVKV